MHADRTIRRVGTLQSPYCRLREVLGEPEVLAHNGLIWTGWFERCDGHCFGLSTFSERPLGRGKSCTCKEAILWDIYSSTDDFDALCAFVDVLTDGEFEVRDADENKVEMT